MTSITITGPEDTTGRSWDIANENGRLAHDIVSRGQELRHEMDFRSGGFGMGETVQQTEAGYFFTQNMDSTRRGIRLSPTVFTVSLADGFPGQPFFFEEGDTATSDFSGTATSTTSTSVTDSGKSGVWSSNEWVGYVVSIAGQNRYITSNTTTVLTVGTAFSPTPGNVRYVINAARYVYVSRKTDFNTVTVSKIRAFDDSVRNTSSTKFDFASPTSGTTTNCDSMPPARFNGRWYHAVSLEGSTDTAAHARLDSVIRTTADDTWTENSAAVSLRGFFLIDQTEGTPQLARVKNKSQVETISTTFPIDLTPDTITDANWAAVGYVGDNSWFVQGASSHAGLTLFGKNDNLFAWDPSGTSYPVIVSLKPTGVVSGISGLGTLNYGSITFYNHTSNLWMIRNLTEVQGVGVDTIDYYSSVPNIVTPIGYTYVEGAVLGERIWYAYIEGDSSYIKMLRVERHPVSKLPIIWNSIIYRALEVRGMFVDGGNRLWWAEVNNTRVAYIQLEGDGSPNSGSRGNNSTTYEWYGPDVDFEMPEIVKQMRYVYLELEGGVSAASWQFKYHRDSGTADSIDSAFTASGGQHLNPTVGTTDTAFRFRPRFTCTTTSLYSLTGISTGSNTSTSFNDSSAGFGGVADAYVGHVIYIREGYGAGQTRRITASSNESLTVTPAWGTTPDASSRYVIAADPRVLRLVLYARTPDTVRVILKVEGTDKNMFEAEKALRKLKDAGPVTIREPGTNENHTGYVKAVNKVAYRDGTTQTGIEAQYQRFTVAV